MQYDGGFCSEKYMRFKALERAGKEKIIKENKCTLTTEYENTMPAATPDFPPQRIIEREIMIDKVKVHVKSVFSDKINIDDALRNIVIRKISETKS